MSTCEMKHHSPSRRKSRLGPSLCLSLACLVILSQPLVAQPNVSASSFFTRGDRGRDVLRVDSVLNASNTMSIGTARVIITAAKGPSTADRDLTVVYTAKSWGSSASNHIAYRTSVRLAEGASAVEVNIPHATLPGQSTWDVKVYEAGRDIEDRRDQTRGNEYQWNDRAGQSTQQLMSIALVGSAENSNQVQANAAALFRANAGVAPVIELITLKDASLDWRQYFRSRFLLVSAATLSEINHQLPELSKVLRSYVACGGMLVIHSAGSSAEMLEIETFLHGKDPGAPAELWTSIKVTSAPWWTRGETTAVASSTSPQAVGVNSLPYQDFAIQDSGMGQAVTSDGEIVVTRDGEILVTNNATGEISYPPSRPVATGTSRPRGELDPLRLTGVLFDGYLMAETWGKWMWGGHLDNLREASEVFVPDRVPSLISDQRQSELRSWLMKGLESEKILSRPYLNGTVLVASKPLVDVPAELAFHASAWRVNPTMQAVNQEMDGDWFWRHLLSAVGKPPVWTFCAMVALFGALIGPGLLLFTGRMKRRSLMIFLVPSLSLLATLSIIAYGILYEGFDTHVRVTSVEFIDPHTREGFAWSRQTYFSGLPPREGLNFDWDTYVRPVQSEGGSRYPGDPDPKNANWVVTLGEQQNWRGWLGAREQQQLLVGHPIEHAQPPITIEWGENDTLLVTNLTQASLPLVVMRGSGDTYYLAQSIAAGATVVAEADTKTVIGAKASRLTADYRPELPPELSVGGSTMRLGSGRRNNVGIGSKLDDVIHSAFSRYLSDKLELPPYGFAAVSTESDNVQVPLQGQSQEDVHLMIGSQAW